MTLISKRKQPGRETHMAREQLRIEEGVFDSRTMMRLSKLFAKGVVSRMRFVIAKGKEADVYLADAGNEIDKEYVALKIFRIENTPFQKRMRYITGDPRFGKIKSDMFSVVNEWCKKEYGNLLVAEAAEIHAPMPYAFNGHILALEFIGEGGTPATPMRHVKLQDPEKVLGIVLEDVRKLYQNELVHADLSEYNILMRDEVPYLIDFGQAVHTKHPESMKFLIRDVENLLHYFSKTYKVEKEFDEVMEYITKEPTAAP